MTKHFVQQLNQNFCLLIAFHLTSTHTILSVKIKKRRLPSVYVRGMSTYKSGGPCKLVTNKVTRFP